MDERLRCKTHGPYWGIVGFVQKDGTIREVCALCGTPRYEEEPSTVPRRGTGVAREAGAHRGCAQEVVARAQEVLTVYSVSSRHWPDWAYPGVSATYGCS